MHILLEFSCHQLPLKVFPAFYLYFFFLDFRFVVRQLSKKFRHVCAATAATAAAASKMTLFFA